MIEEHHEIENQEHEQEEPTTVLEAILKALPQLTRTQQAKVAREAIQLLEKGPTATTKRVGTHPKGVAPPHLAKASAWGQYFLKYHTENGWDEIRVEDKKKQLLEYAASKLEDGKHVFSDTGKPMLHAIAMKLANTDAMMSTDLYREWEEGYIAAGGIVKPKISEEEKAAQEAEAKAEKERVAAEKKADAERKKAEKLEQHKREVAERAEARKKASEEKKAAKEEADRAEKERKAREKEVKVIPEVLKVAAAKPLPAAQPAQPAQPTVTMTPKAPVRPKKVVEEWVPPAEGETKEFKYDGIRYWRDSEDYMWLNEDGQMGPYMGQLQNGVLNTEVADPFVDE
jgi:hypothetical protein